MGAHPIGACHGNVQLDVSSTALFGGWTGTTPERIPRERSPTGRLRPWGSFHAKIVSNSSRQASNSVQLSRSTRAALFMSETKKKTRPAPRKNIEAGEARRAMASFIGTLEER